MPEAVSISRLLVLGPDNAKEIFSKESSHLRYTSSISLTNHIMNCRNFTPGMYVVSFSISDISPILVIVSEKFLLSQEFIVPFLKDAISFLNSLISVTKSFNKFSNCIKNFCLPDLLYSGKVIE